MSNESRKVINKKYKWTFGYSNKEEMYVTIVKPLHRTQEKMTCAGIAVSLSAARWMGLSTGPKKNSTCVFPGIQVTAGVDRYGIHT
jgi:hypothetical protein